MTQAPFYNVGTKKPGFWRRQFAPIPTEAQDKFDTVFAVVLPILFLVLDPIVFKGPRMLGPGYLEDYQLMAYLFCSLETGLFLTWRTFRLPLRRFSSVFGGVFFVGAIFSTVIGILILPLSLLGLMLVIGVLGFTPFVTAFVFLRNGIRAARININGAALHSRLSAAVLSGVLAFGVPVAAQAKVECDVSAAIETLISGSAPEAEAAAQRLKTHHFVSHKHSDDIVTAYANTRDPAKRALLERAYKDITGETIEWNYRRNMVSN
jgi:hypothetical protein